MIKHQINDDAGDRNVQPDRKRHDGDWPMSLAIKEAEINRDARQKWDRRRQQDVRNEDEIVSVSNRGGWIVGERRVDSLLENLVEDVASEKQNRHAEARQHRSLVCRLATTFDQHEASDEQYGRNGVQRSVDVRQDPLQVQWCFL